MRKLAALILALGLLSGADAPRKEDAEKAAALKQELAKIQGAWQMISATRDGSVVPDARVKKTKAEIKGSAITIKFGSWTLASDVKFEIDPTRKPKLMTELVDGGDVAKQSRGIYSLEADKLTICMAAAGKPRPTEFASKAGSGIQLRVFQKVMAKK